jgi:uncharacterized SAM-binding protein YcdF (DUF218 family)
MLSAVTIKRKRILRVVLAAAFLLLAAVLIAVLFPNRFLGIDSGPAKADVIIVLGGGSSDRPQRAAELLAQHAASRIIVSGAGDDEIYRDILEHSGVPPAFIELEPDSRTTKENAQDSIQLLRRENIHSAIIVTSWYHSRRALKCFEHYAPDIRFYSRPTSYDGTDAGWTPRENRRILFEYPKLMGYWVRYGVCPF